MATKGRKAVEINLDELQKTITTLEAENPPPSNRTELWKRVSEVFTPKLSAQSLMTKAEKK